MKKKYCEKLFALTFLLCSTAAFCQTKNYSINFIRVGQNEGCGIKYTSLVPPLSLPTINPWYGGSCSDSLDLNEDGILDLTLSNTKSSASLQGAKYSSSSIYAGDSSYICISSTDSTLADSLIYNDIIDSTKKWAKSGFLYSYYWSLYADSTVEKGYWQNKSYYVGVKILNGNTITYAWVNVDINKINEFAIADSCYIKTYSNIIKVYPSPATDFITIETNSTNVAIANMFNITGRPVFNSIINDKTVVDIRNFDTGVYILSIKMPDKELNKKLVITHN